MYCSEAYKQANLSKLYGRCRKRLSVGRREVEEIDGV